MILKYAILKNPEFSTFKICTTRRLLEHLRKSVVIRDYFSYYKQFFYQAYWMSVREAVSTIVYFAARTFPSGAVLFDVFLFVPALLGATSSELTFLANRCLVSMVPVRRPRSHDPWDDLNAGGEYGRF